MGKDGARMISIKGIWCFVTSVFILLAMITVIHERTYAQNGPVAFPGPKNGNTYVIAHRGAHQFAPENSLLAYRKAIEMGCDFIEIDIRKTKDGRFVSIHNKTVDAYFDHKSGKINDFTLFELKQIPLRNNSDGMDQEYIPTLEEILQLCKGRIGIYLDVKEPDIKNQVQIIKDFRMEHRVIWYIPASYIAVIRQLKMYCDECIVMPDPGPARNVSRVIKKVRPTILASDMDHLSVNFVDKAHRKGVKVFVDDKKATREEWRQILEWGTDGIQTDSPATLIDFLIEGEE